MENCRVDRGGAIRPYHGDWFDFQGPPGTAPRDTMTETILARRVVPAQPAGGLWHSLAGLPAVLPAVLLAGLLWGTALGGCASRTPADPGYRAPAGDLARTAIEWPIRPGDFIDMEVTQGKEIVTLENLGEYGEGRLYTPRWSRAFLQSPGERPYHYEIGPESRVWSLTLDGRLGERTNDPDPDRLASQTLWFSSESYLIFDRFLPDGERVTERLVHAEPDPTELSIIRPEESAPRGTVVFLSSLNGVTSGEDALIEELVRRGWTVVWTAPSAGRSVTGSTCRRGCGAS